MAIHSSILAWRILTDRGDWQATVHGVAKTRTRQRLGTAQDGEIAQNLDPIYVMTYSLPR